MAGAGYKLFNTGDVLTAAQVNTYLQEQVVMVFNDATARTTALSGVLAEGMVSYLKSTDAVEVYNGSAWVSVGSTGDITEVTTAANSGLAGGATSGAVALKLNTAAKGDLLVGTGSGTASGLTVGANDTVLTADSSTATGLKWASVAGGGMTLLSTTTLTGATVTISSISSAYKHLFIELIDFLPATTAVQSRFRLNGDTGSNYAPVDIVNNNWTTFQAYSLFADNVSSTSTTANYGWLYAYDYANTTTWKTVEGQVIYKTNNVNQYGVRSYLTQWKGTSAINSISLFNDTGNWTSGTVKIYGVK